MDTKDHKATIAPQIAEIKDYMPKVYAYIQHQAQPQSMGSQAFALVRRGLRGEANCFYAFESGHVVGTPFSPGPIPDATAALMVKFGQAFVCLFGSATPSAPDATQS